MGGFETSTDECGDRALRALEQEQVLNWDKGEMSELHLKREYL